MFLTDNLPKGILVEFSSDMELVDKCIHEIRTFLSRESEDYQMFLCVRELLINAVEHGNNNDRTKTVHVEVEIDELIEVRITDQGLGVKIEELSLELKGNEGYRKRGLPLVARFSQNLHSKGNTVIATFRIRKGELYLLEEAKPTVSIKVLQSLVASNVELFRHLFLRILSEGYTDIQILIPNQTPIDSMGISLLLSFGKKCRERQITNKMIFPQEFTELENLFKLVQMNSLWSMSYVG
jgi:serine/threonine-protein kinase RsbW